MKNHEQNIAVIVGLDGSGKSTTAQKVASDLSSQYRSSVINVADSSGLYTYREGELASHTFTRVEGMEPSSRCVSKASMFVHLGAFTLGRQHLGRHGQKGADLLISVRDPYRIEPAVYSAVYAPSIGKNIAADKRLKLLDRFTSAPYATKLIHLVCDNNELQKNILARCGPETPDPHEAKDKLAIAAFELPRVISAYSQLFGTQSNDVEALKVDTVLKVTSLIEPILRHGQVIHINRQILPTIPDEALAGQVVI